MIPTDLPLSRGESVEIMLSPDPSLRLTPSPGPACVCPVRPSRLEATLSTAARRLRVAIPELADA
jgi:hypothetical protein